jgi:hypothetical protein
VRRRIFKDNRSESSGPAASASPGNLLELKTLSLAKWYIPVTSALGRLK